MFTANGREVCCCPSCCCCCPSCCCCCCCCFCALYRRLVFGANCAKIVASLFGQGFSSYPSYWGRRLWTQEKRIFFPTLSQSPSKEVNYTLSGPGDGRVFLLTSTKIAELSSDNGDADDVDRSTARRVVVDKADSKCRYPSELLCFTSIPLRRKRGDKRDFPATRANSYEHLPNFGLKQWDEDGIFSLQSAEQPFFLIWHRIKTR